MKFLSPLLAALLISTAAAQTKIGNVTLTKPAAPAPVMRRAAPAVQNTTTNTSNSMDKANVPAGFIEVTGRVSAAAGTVNLPTGSTVSVSVNNLTRPSQVVRIQFKTTRLSTPYQIVFNPGRLNSADTYGVQATVTDASGKLLYSSDRAATLPKGNRAVVNVTVR